MSLALRSQHEWRTNPFYKPFFHQSRMVNIEGTGLGRRMVQTFKDLGVKSEAEVIGPEELRERYPLFWDADYREANDCYVNPEAGWADAAFALRAVIAEAVNYGIHYVRGTVSRLLFDNQGDFQGLELLDGRKLEAGKVILAAGADTAKILADSAPERQELQAGDRIMAAAVVCGMAELTDEQVEVYKDIPLFLHRVGGIHGETLIQIRASFLPPTRVGANTWSHDFSRTELTFNILRRNISTLLLRMYWNLPAISASRIFSTTRRQGKTSPLLPPNNPMKARWTFQNRLNKKSKLWWKAYGAVNSQKMVSAFPPTGSAGICTLSFRPVFLLDLCFHFFPLPSSSCP